MTIKILFLLFLLNFTFFNKVQTQDNTTAKISIVKDTTISFQYKGTLNFTFSNTTYSNWLSGGLNSINIGLITNYNINYDDTNKFFDNFFEVGYNGSLVQGNPLQKNDDHLTMTSKYGKKIDSSWSYSAMGKFNTQLTTGFFYDNPDSVVITHYISTFLSPAYLSFSVGFNYKKDTTYDFLLAPLANRLLIVTDRQLSEAGKFGIPKGAYTKDYFGMNPNLKFYLVLTDKIRLKTQMNLFIPYKNFKTIIVNNNNFVEFDINKNITTLVMMNFAYDDSAYILQTNGHYGPILQYWFNIGLNFVYRF